MPPALSSSTLDFTKLCNLEIPYDYNITLAFGQENIVKYCIHIK